VVFSEYDSERSDALLDPTLPIDELRSRHEEATRKRTLDDDITRALWFHLNAFTGADEEITDIERILKDIGDLSKADLLELPFWSEENGRKIQEKAIFRLQKIGIFADYEVDYGRRAFIIHTLAFDLDRCKKLLLEYVRSAQPAKVKLLERGLKNIAGDDAGQAIIDLSRTLITFTYDVIERSRRRMILESALLARTAKSDKEIRARLLDYLQEGLGAEQLEGLLEDSEVSLNDWCVLLEKIQTPMDAGELRGLCIRSLESYPDHPGLLLVRAAVEAMCSDSDDSMSAQGLETAVRSASTAYDIDPAQIEAAIEALFDIGEARSRRLCTSLTLAVMRLGEGKVIERSIVKKVRSRVHAIEDATCSAVLAVFDIDRLSNVIAAAGTKMVRELGSRAVMESLLEKRE
jgi:ATP-dependent DNA helicase RecQ